LSSSATDAARPFIFQLPAISGRRADVVIAQGPRGAVTRRDAAAEGPRDTFPPLLQRVAIGRHDPYDGPIRDAARDRTHPHDK
jgi:hypothetical protein